MSRERKVAAICKVTRETTNQLNVATFIDDVARLHAKCNRTLGDAMELLQHAPAFCLSSRSWFRPTEERRETSLSPPPLTWSCTFYPHPRPSYSVTPRVDSALIASIAVAKRLRRKVNDEQLVASSWNASYLLYRAPERPVRPLFSHLNSLDRERRRILNSKNRCRERISDTKVSLASPMSTLYNSEGLF